jgi:TatA/E family protein of Tat protein translocase
MIDGITPLHLILVLAIALIVIGPGKLPSVGKALGESLREFRGSLRDETGSPSVDGPPQAPVSPAEGAPVAAVAPMTPPAQPLAPVVAPAQAVAPAAPPAQAVAPAAPTTKAEQPK